MQRKRSDLPAYTQVLKNCFMKHYATMVCFIYVCVYYRIVKNIGVINFKRQICSINMYLLNNVHFTDCMYISIFCLSYL